MALPENNISTALIKNALGIDENSVGALRAHTNNNWWGFSSVLRGWGNRNPSAPYRMGDYRGYDHYFRCWAWEGAVQNNTDFGDPMSMTFNLHWFPSWSTSDSASHTFDILFKRTSDFYHGGYSTIATGVSLSNQTSYSFNVDQYNPPDGGADLESGETFYIAIVHRSSPSLKWDDQMNISAADGQDSGDNYFVLQCAVPTDPYTYDLYYYGANALMYLAGPGYEGIAGSVTLKIDTKVDIYTTVEVQFSKDSNFAVNVQTLTLSKTLAANTTDPGTPQSRTISISGTPSNYFSIGDTVYYRARIKSATSGTVNFNTNWGNTHSLVVLDHLPL